MPLLYLLGGALTITAAVLCVRRGQAQGWLWIILFFGPLGSAIYLLSEFAGSSSFRFATRKVTAADLRRGEAEVRRLDNAHTWAELAAMRLARRDARGAIEAARRAVEHDPQHVEANHVLGCALLERGEPAGAAAALERVVGKDPGYRSGEAAHALALAHNAAGQTDRARATLEELATRSCRPEVLHDLAALQSADGDTAAARATLQRIIDEAQYVPDYARSGVRRWVKRAERSLRSLPPG